MPESFVGEAWSAWAIAVVIIFLRFYARVTMLGWRKLALDDVFMACAMLVYTAETTAAYFVAAIWLGLANSGMTEVQRTSLSPGSQEWRFRVNGSKTHIVGWFTYTTLVWLLKGCWIVYYSRLTAGLPRLQMQVKFGYVFIGTTYAAAILLIVFKCFPLSRQWQIFPDPGNNCQPGFSKLQVSFVMALNTATDLYLMAIPLPMIYTSSLPPRKKIYLFILFSAGFLVITFAILRCVSLLTVRFPPDSSNWATITFVSGGLILLHQVGETNPEVNGLWSVRESFVAVLVSNFPMVCPLFLKWWRKVNGQSTKGSVTNPSYRLDDTPPNKLRSKKRGMYPTFYANDTAIESQEAIITQINAAGSIQRVTDSNDDINAIDLVNKGVVKTTVQAQNTRHNRNFSLKNTGTQGSLQTQTSPGPNHIMVVQEYSIRKETDQTLGA